MPALFVPEERWGKRSWGVNHPLTVAAQIHHGLEEAGYGYWGFSAANVPEGGYRTWGVDGIGMDPNGAASNEDGTLIDRGFAGCPDREPQPDPPRSAYTNGVVSPHAAFLALRYAPAATLANLRAARRRLPRPLHGLGVPRQRERADGRRLGLLPGSRSGDDHGRDRQRTRRRRPAPRLRRPRCRAGDPAADWDRALRGQAKGLTRPSRRLSAVRRLR